TGMPLKSLKVDGGASRDGFLMQFQADVLGAEVIKPASHETTALGVARLAGLTVGLWKDGKSLAAAQKIDKKYLPDMPTEIRAEKMRKWHRAVERSLGWELSE
ncbi:MAG: glycerol kinase, partial [Clostridia bacterium]|nr:glycerol kinase [Clostridia bacterium]